MFYRVDIENDNETHVKAGQNTAIQDIEGRLQFALRAFGESIKFIYKNVKRPSDEENFAIFSIWMPHFIKNLSAERCENSYINYTHKHEAFVKYLIEKIPSLSINDDSWVSQLTFLLTEPSQEERDKYQEQVQELMSKKISELVSLVDEIKQNQLNELRESEEELLLEESKKYTVITVETPDEFLKKYNEAVEKNILIVRSNQPKRWLIGFSYEIGDEIFTYQIKFKKTYRSSLQKFVKDSLYLHSPQFATELNTPITNEETNSSGS